MSPFAIPGRRRGSTSRQPRPRLQGLVDRWVGVNLRQAQTAPRPDGGPTAPISGKSQPGPSGRPTKRASYAGHELSFSDLRGRYSDFDDEDSSSSGGSCDQDQDQATLCTAATGELTQGTTAASLAARAAEEGAAAYAGRAPLIPAMPMPQLRRRVSAPPILGLTVETPSPPMISKTVFASVTNEAADNDNILVSSEDSSIASVAFDEDDDGQAQRSTSTSTSRTGTSSAPAAEESTASSSRAAAAEDVATPPSVMPQLPLQDTPPNFPRRSLRFNPKTKVYHHLHLDDYTDAEYEASYQTERDMRRIQVDAVESIHQMRANAANGANDAHHDMVDAEEQDEVCSRGLEAMVSPAVAAAHRTARAAVRDAVLDEQDLQFMGDVYDEGRLAATSAAASADSTMEAILRAASDAAYVQRFVRSEDDDDDEDDDEDEEREASEDEDEEDEMEISNTDQAQQQDQEDDPATAATNDEAPPPAAAANGMESLSSILQEALDVSMHGEVEALEDISSSPGTNDDDNGIAPPRPNPSSLSRIGSRERLLDVLGQLRSDMAQARMEFQDVSHVVRRDSRRSSSSDEASQSSA